MRPGPEFPTMSHGGAPMVTPGANANANATAPHSPWQSPVPYLFGGLAAMLGLIAFALLILACSYWKLSGYLDADRDQRRAGSSGNADGEKGSAAGAARPAAGFLEHVVVIMAGEERPTFLATPAASRAAVVELGAVTAASGSSSGEGEGEERKAHVDDDGEDCELQEGPRLGANADAETDAVAGAVSRSSETESSTSTSRATAALAE